MKHIPWASALLLGLVAGVLIGRLPGITIQNTIDLDGLISLFIGLVLFFGLNLLYQRQFTVQRAEKDILIKLASDALSAAESLDAAFERCHAQDPLLQGSVFDITAGLQRYNNAVHTLDAALRDCKIGENKVSLNTIHEHREQYRAVLTDAPFPTRYEPSARREQQRHQLAVREAFIALILRLNRL
jgi:hypothetical protein